MDHLRDLKATIKLDIDEMTQLLLHNRKTETR